jgi:hypothetical protein
MAKRGTWFQRVPQRRGKEHIKEAKKGSILSSKTIWSLRSMMRAEIWHDRNSFECCFLACYLLKQVRQVPYEEKVS